MCYKWGAAGSHARHTTAAMSYQLVHKHAESTPGDHNYTCSGGIPGWLELSLVELGAPGCGTRYSYRVIKGPDRPYHIFTRCCDTGSPEHPCRLAHHLALTTEEANAMLRHEAGPTPAGIMLALGRQGFWLENLPDSGSTLLDSQPKLSATELPDASTQPTWKALTGHKDNARSYNTSPYTEESLSLLPQGTGAETILHLLHESDWLVPGLGWGRSFTTAGTVNDRFEDTGRIIACSGMLPGSWVRNCGRPLLLIESSLVLPEEAPAPAPAARADAPPAIARQEAPLLPYSYAEPEDQEIYNVPAQHRYTRRHVIGLSLLALLAVGLYFGIYEGADDVGGAARQAIRQYTTDENTAALRRLLELPYSPQVARQKLGKISRHLNLPHEGEEPDEQATRLHECIELLRNARHRETGHAANLQRLIEAANLLRLPTDRLATFYLCEATRERDTTAWRHAQREAGERAAWRALAERYPQAERWAEEPMLAAFMQGIVPSSGKQKSPAP